MQTASCILWLGTSYLVYSSRSEDVEQQNSLWHTVVGLVSAIASRNRETSSLSVLGPCINRQLCPMTWSLHSNRQSVT